MWDFTRLNTITLYYTSKRIH